MVSDLSGKGCVGLSLRATTIAAGIITLIESVVWLGLSVTAFLTYECKTPVPADMNMRLRVAYVTYFLNPACRADLGEFTPAGESEVLHVDGDVVSTAYRTFQFAIVYMVLSALWLCTSVLLLVTVAKGAAGRPASHLCAPWLLLTAVTMVTDLVATGFYAVDTAGFNSLDALQEHSGLSIPATWFLEEPEVKLNSGGILLTVVSVRGILIWTLNAVLLRHVARAARHLARGGDDKGPRSPRGWSEDVTPRTTTAPGSGLRREPSAAEVRPQWSMKRAQESGPAAAPEAAPEAAPVILPVRSRHFYLPGEAPSAPVSPMGHRRAPMRRSLTPPPRTPSRADGGRPRYERSASRPPTRQVPRPAERSDRQSPRFSDHGRQSPRFSDQGGQSPTRFSDHDRQSPTRFSDHESRSSNHEERPAATREEILHRIERMSVLRTSGRGEKHGVSPAIEAKTREIFRGLAASGSGIPLDFDPRRPQRNASQRHVRNNSADLDAPAPRRQLQRSGTAAADSPRWQQKRPAPQPQLQPQQQPPQRPRRRLDRTQSDRNFAAGERDTARQGNLHGLSPRHATEELKRQKPWNYLRAAAVAHEEEEEEEDDVFEDGDVGPRHSPNRVARNMYPPPASGDATRRASSASTGSKRRSPQ